MEDIQCNIQQSKRIIYRHNGDSIPNSRAGESINKKEP